MMKHFMRTLLLVSGALSLTISMITNVAADANEEGQVALVCYKWDAFPNERLRVSIRKPADITETVPAQVTWGLTGKHIGSCGENTMSLVRGSIVADEAYGTAHMGIYSLAVRDNDNAESCRAVNWNCSASLPVRAPETWSCESRNEFDVYHSVSSLTKVTDTQGDPLCGVFEAALSSPNNAVASGTKQ